MGHDFSMPNDKPGECCKCKGTGAYRWGANVNGKSQFTGTCWSCKGTGKQSAKQIKTNHAYNRHKVVNIGW